ncbi:MAG: SUMF1/EgtB/PvdO family nonheme iron enzyme [Ardenticatenaceae bacterium]|nr:SUMF1/EgtB/PvdO family nonheme iron enzyme [Ardenticatenaceae bacterium]
MSEQFQTRVRKFLQEYFSDDDLMAFCFDYFPVVYRNFTAAMPKNQKILRLISYCQQRDIVDDLLEALKKERAEQFEPYFVNNPRLYRPKKNGKAPNNKSISKQILFGLGVILLAIVVIVFLRDLIDRPYNQTPETVELEEGEVTAAVTNTRASDFERTQVAFQTETPSGEPPTPTMPKTLAAVTEVPIPTPSQTQIPISAASETPTQDFSLPMTMTRQADGMIMVLVQGGTFIMGSTPTEIEQGAQLCDESQYNTCLTAFQNESRQEVTLSSFWMDKTEVTNAQYLKCLSCAQPAFIETPEFSGPDQPVVGITWDEANTYCLWADSNLPTEAQWEYAARGVDGRIFPWGNEVPTPTNGFAAFHLSAIPNVGSFPKGDSWSGLSDLAGSVSEWVDRTILRGGHWNTNAANLRSARRIEVSPTADPLNFAGFRCSRSLEP